MSAERVINVPAEVVYHCIAEMAGGLRFASASQAQQSERIKGVPGARASALSELPSDAAESLAQVDDIVATFHREGQAAAPGTFLAHIAMPADERRLVPSAQALDQATADGARLLGHGGFIQQPPEFAER